MTERKKVLLELVKQSEENTKLARENIKKNKDTRLTLERTLEESFRWTQTLKEMIKDGEFKNDNVETPKEASDSIETLDQCKCGNKTFEKGHCTKCSTKRKIWIVWVTSEKNPSEFRIVCLPSTQEDADKRRKAYNETAIARGQDQRYYSERALVDHLFGSSFNRGDYY